MPCCFHDRHSTFVGLRYANPTTRAALWVCDVTYDEDRCRVRKGNGLQIMASLCYLAISPLRMARAAFIAPALWLYALIGQNVLRFLGLTF